MRTHLLVTAAALVAAGALAPVAISAQEAPPPPKKNLEVTGTAGFAQTSGNANATTTNFGNKVKYTAKGWALAEDLAFFYGKAEDKVNANFWNGGLRAERRIMERIGLFVATRYDRNVLQGIAHRFEEGFGVDVKAIVSKRDQLSLQAGGSLFQQRLTAGSTPTSGKRNFPAARLGLDYKHNFTELAYFQQTGEYLPNLSDSKAYLMNTESSLVAPLSRRLGLKLSYLVRYNNSPPIRENVQLKTTDTFFSSGITVSF